LAHIKMEIDWTSPRIVKDAVTLLDVTLPRVISSIVAEYARSYTLFGPIRAEMNAPMVAWIFHPLGRCMNESTKPKRGEFYIKLYSPGIFECTHTITISDQDLWDFMWGEPAAVVEEVIARHTNDAAAIVNCVYGARESLRREVSNGAERLSLRADRNRSAKS
jgi:hypothetical protein